MWDSNSAFHLIRKMKDICCGYYNCVLSSPWIICGVTLKKDKKKEEKKKKTSNQTPQVSIIAYTINWIREKNKNLSCAIVWMIPRQLVIRVKGVDLENVN